MAHGKVVLSNYPGEEEGKISQRAQLKKDGKTKHTNATALLAHHTEPAEQKAEH